MFTKEYPSVTILLKGANTIIAKDNKRFINNSGTPNLSKGGSGDVLSGLIASLLAQGYNCLDATITASLAHSFAAQNFTKNSYALTPQDIIDEVTKL
jgi:NAD(P)H-hydrate repair Nnr-like enzyme with NAD(P)H-hydrate dehydratase domain